MEPDIELTRQWLEHANRDLRSAEVLLAAEPPLIEDASFHCQQAAEKALKAYLVHRCIEFERSHDLIYLLDLCVRHDEAFEQWYEESRPLTDHAVRFRYPHPGPAPTLDEGRRSIEVAQRMSGFVLDRLPHDTHPPA